MDALLQVWNVLTVYIEPGREAAKHVRDRLQLFLIGSDPSKLSAQ